MWHLRRGANMHRGWYCARLVMLLYRKTCRAAGGSHHTCALPGKIRQHQTCISFVMLQVIITYFTFFLRAAFEGITLCFIEWLVGRCMSLLHKYTPPGAATENTLRGVHLQRPPQSSYYTRYTE